MKMKFNNLLKESQFHAGRRLAETKCSWYWLVSMLLFFGAAVSVIHVTIQRFYQNPTFMIQLESVVNPSQFPSVSVCPEIFYRDDLVDEFLERIMIPPHLNTTYLKSVVNSLAAYYSPDIVYRTHDLKNIEDVLEYNGIPVDTAAKAMTASCESTLLKCRWDHVIVNCSDLFSMELTGDGYCCVFNGRSLAREFVDGHRHGTTSYNKYYTYRYGFTSGLMVAVNQSQITDSVDLSYKWLAIQGGQNYVESTINGSALSPGTEHWAEYQPHNFQIADEARGLSDSLRKCRMADEALEFFPVYNQRYCGVECELANTLKRCKCIRLVHPRTRDAPYCNSHQMLCAKLAMVSYDSEVCNCPTACDLPQDTIKVSSHFLDPAVTPIDTFYEDLNFSKTTVVRVYIRNSIIRTDARISYFSNFDLFAQLGGVFNVFFGCSILTLLEIFILACRGGYSFITEKKKKKTSRKIEEAGFKDIKSYSLH